MSDKAQVVEADPPWFYNSRGEHTRFGGGASKYYDLMKTEEICKIPVASMVDESAVLFLWATWPNLKDGFDVMEAWGFEYKTIGFNWVKTNRKNGKNFFGVGYYTKSNSEPCLFGVRGKILRPYVNDVSSIIETFHEERGDTFKATRGEHSEKPEEAYQRIERMYPGERKLQLFARRKRRGWGCVGSDLGHILTPEGVEASESQEKATVAQSVRLHLFDIDE